MPEMIDDSYARVDNLSGISHLCGAEPFGHI
jgi:hypothetical protein